MTMKAKDLAKLLLKHPEVDVFVESDEADYLCDIDGACFIKKLTDGGEETFGGIALLMGAGSVERANPSPKGFR